MDGAMRTGSTLEEVRTIDDFVRNPVGRYLCRPAFTYWYPQRGFTGFTLKGWLRGADIRELNGVTERILPLLDDQHASLVDASRLTVVDPEAYWVMVDYILKRRTAFSRLIRQQALVRPGGPMGAFVAGFYADVIVEYAVAVFRNVDAATTWLGVPSFPELARPDSSADKVLAQLRDYLNVNLLESNLETTAEKMGVKSRTLQRWLKGCGTSYNAELIECRLSAAKQLMRSTDLSLTDIAAKAGFASLQHFSSVFRKAISRSPSEWRRSESTVQADQHRTQI